MAVERWAMIRDGVVENVCLWDGLLTTWQPPAGIEMQPAGDIVAIGWRWDGSQWLEPLPPEPQPDPAPDTP